MTTAWQTFLQPLGATLDENGRSRFANDPAVLAELDAANVIVPLSHYGLLRLQGPDSEKFLQGQITCNAAETNPALSTPGAYCTPKGRTVCSFQLARPAADQFLLRMRGDLLDSAAKTFGKYIVFSKAKLTVADDLLALGLHGPNVAAMLQGIAAPLPVGRNGTAAWRDGLLLARDDSGNRFEYWGPAAAAAELWTLCAAQCRPAGGRYWDWLNIRAGEAEICAATTETFLPQMLNYHLNGAISFKKGCYTGQEIVARTHYRGQVKRQLLRATLTGPAPLPGSDIADASGKTVGNVVDSVAIDDRDTELLAVVSGAAVAASDEDEAQNEPAKLSAGGAILRPLPLPYAIP